MSASVAGSGWRRKAVGTSPVAGWWFSGGATQGPENALGFL
jgi:hypothetical protein